LVGCEPITDLQVCAVLLAVHKKVTGTAFHLTVHVRLPFWIVRLDRIVRFFLPLTHCQTTCHLKVTFESVSSSTRFTSDSTSSVIPSLFGGLNQLNHVHSFAIPVSATPARYVICLLNPRSIASDHLALIFLILFRKGVGVRCDDSLVGEDLPTVDESLGRFKEASRTDEESLARLAADAQRFEFQTEVDRMMKMIINSLYKNKDIFLRELISNASDALDKIRLLALTDPKLLDKLPELAIRIKADKEKNLLHISDTGVGMSKEELIANLGTIAKSGTAEFLKKNAENEKMAPNQMSDLIGQFGVGFYSAFLVADKVTVPSKSYDSETQFVWESDSKSFSISEDPRGDTLTRGTQITLHLKDEAKDFLQEDTLNNLIVKYSQFINFPIYLWKSRTETVEEPIDDETVESAVEKEEKKDDEDALVEDVKEDEPADKKKTKKVEKTTWEWELINVAKPIWTRKADDISDEDYNAFYKSITKDSTDPLAKIHFTAEGEVTFKSLLFVPQVQPSESFNKYGTKTEAIRMYVRRVFITDDFQDMLPNYLAFVRGVVDSDDLPLNVSRETLQQHKLLKIIKKKLVRKVLDMLRKVSDEDYEKFWAEYSTNIKLGVIEDSYNRNRLAKLLRFQTSALEAGKFTSLSDYVTRMKPNQKTIYYMAGTNWEEVARSPFVEGLQRKGFEVLYLTDAIDEYAISAMPDFEENKFQNVAKDGLKLDDEGAKSRQEQAKERFEPLLTWLEKNALKEKIQKATISQRLHDSPCALVASQFGWTGNMERLARSNAHSKSKDVTRDFYLSQKKTLELNPRHPLVKELLRRVSSDEQDETAQDMALLLFDTATLRSGYQLADSAAYASRVEVLLRRSLGVSESEPIEEDEPEDESAEKPAEEATSAVPDTPIDQDQPQPDEHEEL
jgi:heat shock protein beta